MGVSLNMVFAHSVTLKPEGNSIPSGFKVSINDSILIRSDAIFVVMSSLKSIGTFPVSNRFVIGINLPVLGTWAPRRHLCDTLRNQRQRC